MYNYSTDIFSMLSMYIQLCVSVPVLVKQVDISPSKNLFTCTTQVETTINLQHRVNRDSLLRDAWQHVQI